MLNKVIDGPLFDFEKCGSFFKCEAFIAKFTTEDESLPADSYNGLVGAMDSILEEYTNFYKGDKNANAIEAREVLPKALSVLTGQDQAGGIDPARSKPSPHWIDRLADGIAAAFESRELPKEFCSDLNDAILSLTNDYASHAEDNVRNLLPIALRRAIGMKGDKPAPQPPAPPVEENDPGNEPEKTGAKNLVVESLTLVDAEGRKRAELFTIGPRCIFAINGKRRGSIMIVSDDATGETAFQILDEAADCYPVRLGFDQFSDEPRLKTLNPKKAEATKDNDSSSFTVRLQDIKEGDLPEADFRYVNALSDVATDSRTPEDIAMKLSDIMSEIVRPLEEADNARE